MAQTQIRGGQIFDDDITSDDIADAAVRGATGNAGTQREIAVGTVSTIDLRDDAVDAAKLLETDDYSMNTLSLTATTGNSLVVDTNTLIVDASNDRVSIGGSPVTDAILTLESTTQAFLPPRMTTTQRDNIGTPAAGMLVYNTTTSALNIYNGSSWGTPPVTETDPLSIHLDGSNSPSANIDWDQNQILNLVVHVLSSDPGSPVEGQIWYNSTDKQWKGYQGTSTVILG